MCVCVCVVPSLAPRPPQLGRWRSKRLVAALGVTRGAPPHQRAGSPRATAPLSLSISYRARASLRSPAVLAGTGRATGQHSQGARAQREEQDRRARERERDRARDDPSLPSSALPFVVAPPPPSFPLSGTRKRPQGATYLCPNHTQRDFHAACLACGGPGGARGPTPRTTRARAEKWGGVERSRVSGGSLLSSLCDKNVAPAGYAARALWGIQNGSSSCYTRVWRAVPRGKGGAGGGGEKRGAKRPFSLRQKRAI